MLLNIDPDQEVLRDTTARFLDEQVPVDTLRRLRDDPTGWPEGYWRQGADLGWTSLLVQESDGGGSISGLGLVDLTIVAHEFGLRAAPGPLAAANVAAGALSAAGGHGQVLAQVLAGETIVPWAHGEPAPGDRLGQIACTVTFDGDSVVVDGVKRPVESAGEASHVLVTGRGPKGLVQVLVPTDAEGVSLRSLQSVDLTRRFSELRCSSVRLDRSAVVGDPDDATGSVTRQLHQAIVIANAESVGAMQRAFDITVEWAFDRYSFGRPLASYQALKHRYADMKMHLEASHALADGAAAAVATDAHDAPELVSAAKAYIALTGSELMQEAVQLHGGLGVTFEHDIHLFMRRHTVNRTMFGTPSEHLRRITDELTRQAVA